MTVQNFRFTHPKIIIGVPAFNEQKYIHEALSSLSNQTWQDFIVIISDNSSTDDTKAICEHFCATDTRFHYIRQKHNIGAGQNFEYLYEISNSPYFMWLGAHDALEPEFLSIHLSILDSHSQYVLSYSSTQWIDESGKETHTTKASELNTIKGIPIIRYIGSLRVLYECTAVNQVIRRKALNGKFYHVIAGDHIILSRLLYRGEVYKTDQALYKRRDFLKRKSTTMERISGLKQTNPDYQFLVDSYMKDFLLLETTFFVRTVCAPIVYWILKDRFVKKIPTVQRKILIIYERIIISLLNLGR